MKSLIAILKTFHIICVMIFALNLYAVFARGLEFIPFAGITFLMAYWLRKDYMQMEEEIGAALDIVVEKVNEECSNLDCTDFELEVPHNGKTYYIEGYNKIDYRESRGAEHLGYYERVIEILKHEITIYSVECIDDCTGEVTDCGFTEKDIQEWL